MPDDPLIFPDGGRAPSASWDGRRIVVGERGRPFVRSIAALFDLYLARQCDKPRHSRAV